MISCVHYHIYHKIFITSLLYTVTYLLKVSQGKKKKKKKEKEKERKRKKKGIL